MSDSKHAEGDVCNSSSSSDDECSVSRPFNYGDDIKVSRNAHDAKAVPLGGKNIPRGMLDDDWQSRDSIGIVEPLLDSSAYGPEYVRIENQRKKLAQIKKDLTVLHKYVIKYQEGKDEKVRAERNKVLDLLTNDIDEFKETAWYQQYIGVRDKASKDDLTADDLITFAHDDVKRLSQQIFNYNMKLLQELKKTKQQYATNNDTGAPSTGEGSLLGDIRRSPR
jgi:hypothetical protein